MIEVSMEATGGRKAGDCRTYVVQDIHITAMQMVENAHVLLTWKALPKNQFLRRLAECPTFEEADTVAQAVANAIETVVGVAVEQLLREGVR